MITQTRTLDESTHTPRPDAVADDSNRFDAELPQSDGRRVETVAWTEPTHPAAVDGFPVPDYPNLTVPEIIRHANRMSPDGLREIKAYEKSHRRRKTLLTKLERMLRAPAAAGASDGPPRAE